MPSVSVGVATERTPEPAAKEGVAAMIELIISPVASVSVGVIVNGISVMVATDGAAATIELNISSPELYGTDASEEGSIGTAMELAALPGEVKAL